MCDEIDETCSVWRQTYHRARKPHSCLGCHETIQPGHRYCLTTFLFDGAWDSYKHCLRCATMIDVLHERFRKMGEHWRVVDPELDCGDVWNDPPPEVQELAFMLPGEGSVPGEATP